MTLLIFSSWLKKFKNKLSLCGRRDVRTVKGEGKERREREREREREKKERKKKGRTEQE